MLVSIVYDSGYGHTAKLAQYVAEGVSKVSVAEAKLVAAADDISWEILEKSYAIIFGSPTYNGLLSSRLKKFFEDSTKKAWFELKWRNKIVAGFTNSGAQIGDKLNTLVSMVLFAAQHGMIWVGLDLLPGPEGKSDLNRLGSWLGAMALSDNASPDVTPPECDFKTAAFLGQRVADVASRFNQK